MGGCCPCRVWSRRSLELLEQQRPVANCPELTVCAALAWPGLAVWCLQGIFVDGEGNVSEGPNMNIACLLVSPPRHNHRPPTHHRRCASCTDPTFLYSGT